ncbi:MAG: polysaccharide biosynthesis C-terminal domain-containing protein [Saprospiraceae bacterium]|nr:polysaccharide biosynthesis C-terminal domain-containing protein [Saprospiraceae bacterium]
MRREFLLNIFFLVGINLLIKPLYIFGIDLKVQNTLGTQTYGLFAALFSLSYILQIINDAGLQQFNNQTISQDRSLLRDQYPRLLGLKFWLALIYLIACAVFATSIGYGLEVLPLLLHIAFNQVLLSWILFLRSNISGVGYYRKDSLVSVLDKFLMLAICGVMLYHPVLAKQFTLSWFIWAQTASFVITIAIARTFLRGHDLRFTRSFSWSALRPLVIRSLPFALAVLLMSAYTRMDTLMLERLLPDGEHQAGIYYMAYRLLDAANNVALLFAGLLLPMLAQQLSRKENIQPLIVLGSKLLVAGSMVTAVAVSRYAQPIIHTLYHHAPEEAVSALRYLIWSFVPVSMMYVFGTLLTAGARLGLMNKVLLITVLLNFVLLWIMIPLAGAVGAAKATLITQSFVASCMIILSFLVMPLRVNGRELTPILVYVLLMTVLFFIPYTGPASWIIQFVVILLSGFGIAAVLGLLPARNFLHLLRSRTRA